MKIEKWPQMTVSRLTAWSGGDFFDGGDVQRGEGDAAAVIEPDDDAITGGVNPGVIRAWDRVTMTAAGNDGKGFEGAGL